jgi:hypothetical protein
MRPDCDASIPFCPPHLPPQGIWWLFLLALAGSALLSAGSLETLPANLYFPSSVLGQENTKQNETEKVGCLSTLIFTVEATCGKNWWVIDDFFSVRLFFSEPDFSALKYSCEGYGKITIRSLLRRAGESKATCWHGQAAFWIYSPPVVLLQGKHIWVVAPFLEVL